MARGRRFHHGKDSADGGTEWWTDFSREEHTRLLNTIGNLVLTHDNSSYSNHDYSRKRGTPGQETLRCYYSTSALARERQIAVAYEVWTPVSIEHRRGAIEEWALRRWSVAAPENTVPSDDDDDGEAVTDLLEVEPDAS